MKRKNFLWSLLGIPALPKIAESISSHVAVQDEVKKVADKFDMPPHQLCELTEYQQRALLDHRWHFLSARKSGKTRLQTKLIEWEIEHGNLKNLVK